MTSDQHNVLVTFSPPPEVLQTLGQELGGIATITVLPELENGQRTRALTAADAVLAWGPASELRGPDEAEQLASTRLIQLLSAGVNHVPFDWFPRGVPLASNAGAYSEPMAEHVLAMALALLKRLPQNHAELARGVFERSVLNRSLRGSVVGILGFGGIGQATARVFSALGARVFAVNRSGRTSERVEWIRTAKDIDRPGGIDHRGDRPPVDAAHARPDRCARAFADEARCDSRERGARAAHRRRRAVRPSATCASVFGWPRHVVAGTVAVRAALSLPGPSARPWISPCVRANRGRVIRCRPKRRAEHQTCAARRAGPASGGSC